MSDFADYSARIFAGQICASQAYVGAMGLQCVVRILMSEEMHCAQQMIIALENEKNFLAREYPKVATVRAASSEIIVILAALRMQ